MSNFHKPLSNFVKANFEKSIISPFDSDVNHVLKQIQNLEFSKKESQFNKDVPKVVLRLLNDSKEENFKSKSTNKNLNIKKIKKKKKKEFPEKNKKNLNLDIGPSSSHYSPNYNSILTSTPGITMTQEQTPIISTTKHYTMNEMMNKFLKNIRKNESLIENDNKSILVHSDISLQSSFNNDKGYKFSQSTNFDRDSFIVAENTPGPSAYNISKEIEIKGVEFNKQASRPDIVQNEGHHYRDTRSNLDFIRPRAISPIPFNKQSSREPQKINDDNIWKEIDEEQKKLITNLFPKEEKKNIIKPKKQPFELQTTTRIGSPFKHLIRNEIEPKEEYNIKIQSRPVTSFNISQPSFKNQRTIYIKSEAPDKFYDNINETYNKNKFKNEKTLKIGPNKKKNLK